MEGKMNKAITVQTIVDVPVEKAWDYWTKPEHITKWTFASDDWEAPFAENDLQVNGKFKTRMQSKDKTEGFDFTGRYTYVKEHELIEYVMDDGRKVSILFERIDNHTQIIETFDPESENPSEMQRNGWQAILNNFKKYAEKQK